MAVCFFNKEYETKYNCEYKMKELGMEVIVDYEIDDEIPAENGVKIFSTDIKFENRDILIVDYQNKINFLLKKAKYIGHTEVWGTPDDGCKTRFYSNWYFSDNDFNKLRELKPTPKINKIRIYSNLVNKLIGCPSLSISKYNDENVIKLKKDSQLRTIEINNYNIKNITIGDCWSRKHNGEAYSINIKLNGYLELELLKRVNYDDIYDYIYELITFIQLLMPDKLNISRIIVFIYNIPYEFHLPLRNRQYEERNVKTSVAEDAMDFLKNCYNSIPYRNDKSEIRNIPYIVLNTYRGLEDNFLMFYRFIECYYKKQNIKGIVTSFINYSIKKHYSKVKHMDDEEIENKSQEIISLRNHYVHAGYYISNNSLRIKFKDIDELTPNPKNYTARIDVDWIYERTKILYDIVIDIIFCNMLGYKKYEFKRHF